MKRTIQNKGSFEIQKPAVSLMLDSGAFSVWSRGEVLDIDEYAEFIKKYGGLFEVSVNLDVIGDGKGSYNNWLYLRKQGVEVMPVYHIGTDEKYLKKYLAKAEYIGLGGIAKVNDAKRYKSLDYLWRKYIVDSKGIATHKVHGFGITSVNLITQFPWHSVDSVSPIIYAGFGGIYVPRIEKNDFNFLKLDMYKISGKASIHIKGNSGSWTNLPYTIHKKYSDYFNENGFHYNGITNFNHKDLPMFGEQAPEETDEFTIIEHHPLRTKWNLFVWQKFNELIPDHNRPIGVKITPSPARSPIKIYIGNSLPFLNFKHLLGSLHSFADLRKGEGVKSKILRHL